MRLKPKTVRRLLLLAVVALLVVGGAFSLFVVRGWQTTRRLEGHRRDGMAAFAAGNHRKAIEELVRYVQADKPADPEVWLALAEAGQKLEQPDFGHLRSAARSLREYVLLKPDDHDRRLEFVRLSNQTGSYVDALDAAQRLRPTNFDQCTLQHIDVLREEAIALTASRIYNDRLDAVVDRLLSLAPLDLQGNLIRLEHWGRTNRKPEARQAAQALATTHPQSPVAQLIFAASYLIEPTPEDVSVARVKLAQSVGLDPLTAEVLTPVQFSDADFTSRAVDLLDRLQAFEHALAVLKLWHAQHAGTPASRIETGLARTLARRLWQNGDYAALDMMAPVGRESESDSEVLAFRALSSASSPVPERRATMADAVKALESRPDDYRAAAWNTVLPLVVTSPDAKRDAREDVETLKAVIKSTNRSEPVFVALLGDTYASLARMDEARDAWKSAGEMPICASWSYPHIRRAETFLAEGRATEAVECATQALMVAPSNPSINALWFDAQALRVQTSPPNTPGIDVPALAQTIERVNQQVEAAGPAAVIRPTWERLLPSRVLLMARAGQSERATALARHAISSSEPLSDRTLQRLASVSISERLGFEHECLSRAEGATSPSIALARAIELAKAGRIDEGMAVLASLAASGTPEALLAQAQFMEHVGNADATAVWVALGDRFADNVAIQRACLGSASSAGDAAFIDRTIERYQKLAGLDRAASEDALVRTARAKVLLRGGPTGLTAKNRDAAVAMLAQVTAANPKLVEPKVLLARALLISDAKRAIRADEPRAASLLAEALSLEPRSAPIAVELAALHIRMREPSKAREVLARIAADPSGDPAGRHIAAAMLLNQGSESAVLGVKALEDIDQLNMERGSPTSTAVMVDLGEALAVQRQVDKARKVFARLVADPSASPDHLFRAARFYQRAKDEAAVTAIIDSASRQSPGSGPLIKARLAEESGELESAWRLFEDSIVAEPGNIQAWNLYASALMSRARGVEARKVAERAAAAFPGNSQVRLLLERARIAAAPADGQPDFAPLIAALSSDPSLAARSGVGGAEGAEVLRAIEQAQRQGDFDDPSRIMDLADRFPGMASLQLYLAQRIAASDPSRAVILANRAQTLAPTDARAFKSIAELYLSMGRWTDLISAATTWKQLESGLSPEPDLAIAQARLNTRDYRGGLATLRPWIETARANPESPLSLAVLNVQCRLLIASGQEPQARELLQPLIARSADLRTAVWIRAAAEAIPTASVALAWLTVAREHIPAEAESEHIAVAAALSNLASRFPDQSSSFLAEAKTLLASLTSGATPAGAAAWEALGMVCHRERDTAAARAAYERALALDANRPVSLNNMASLLLETGSDLNAALAFAQRAVEVTRDAFSLTTLGSVQHAIAVRDRAAGRTETTSFVAAAESFQHAAHLRPGDPAAWIRLAESATDAGNFKAAAAAWERVAAIPDLAAAAIAATKNNQAAVMLREELSRDELARARQLVEEAVQIVEEPAFFDTLGWIELLAGRRDRAVESFRRAIAGAPSDPKSPSPTIGLATALAGGTEQDRREAATLLESVKKDDLPPYLQERLQRVRSMVQVDKP